MSLHICTTEPPHLHYWAITSKKWATTYAKMSQHFSTNEPSQLNQWTTVLHVQISGLFLRFPPAIDHVWYPPPSPNLRQMFQFPSGCWYGRSICSLCSPTQSIRNASWSTCSFFVYSNSVKDCGGLSQCCGSGYRSKGSASFCRIRNQIRT